MPVSMKFKQIPLSEVLDYLKRITQVNMYIDAEGLKAEGVSGDEPVTIDLSRDIQLKSALALILAAVALELRDQGRSAQDHQRRPAARAGLYQELSGGRPGDSDSEFQPRRPARHQRGLARGLRPHRLRRRERRRRLCRGPLGRDGRRSEGTHEPECPGPIRAAGRHRRRAQRHGAAKRLSRPGRRRRRQRGRLRLADRADHFDGRPVELGFQRRRRLDRPVRHESDAGRQPDAGNSRANRRPAEAVAPAARFASDDRSAIHHARRRLLRKDRRRLQLQHSHQRDQRHRRRLQRQSDDAQRGRRLEFDQLGHIGVHFDTRRRRAIPPKRHRQRQHPGLHWADGRHDAGVVRLCDPQRHPGVFLGASPVGRRPLERAASPEGHAVQRPAGVRVGHVARAVRDQRDPGGGRFRGGTAAGDRRASPKARC